MNDHLDRARAGRLLSLADHLNHWASRKPTALAVSDGPCRLSYKDLAGLVDSCARVLLGRGVGFGDRVAMLTTPGVEFLIMFLALQRIGAVWVGLNPRHRLAELDYVIEDCTPCLLLGISGFEGRDYREDLQALARRHGLAEPVLFGGEQPDLRFFDLLGPEASQSDLQAAGEQVMPCGPACVIYTSGSTGRPKGALLGHHGLLVTHQRWIEYLDVDEMRIISDLPIDHIGGLERAYLSIMQGGTVLFQKRFEPHALLCCVERERVTCLLGELAQWIKCAPLLEQYDLSSLQVFGYYGGQPTLGLLEQYRSVVPRIFTGYGMTETSNAVLLSDFQSTSEALSEHNVGRPIPGVMTRLVDSADRTLDRCAEGFMQIRSDTLFLEYLNRSQATADAFTHDGWFRTGDIFRERSDGSFDFLGRADQTFKSGGYNIYPREIEALLESHPEIACAAVISVPDEVFQSVGHAFVQPLAGQAPQADQLLDWCRTRLANYKIPKMITVLAQLPTLANEKIDRMSLQALARGEHN